MSTIDILGDYEISWVAGAFGNADASRENLDAFIDVPGVFERPDKNPDAMRQRVIVGRKGSGKTFYMRMLREDASRRGIFTSEHVETLDTISILKYHDLIEQYAQKQIEKTVKYSVDQNLLVVETWSLAWDKAIVAGLLSLIVNSKGGMNTEFKKGKAFKKLVSELNGYRDILKLKSRPKSISSSLSNIMTNISDHKEFTSFMSNPDWVELRDILAELVRMSPPISIVIDSIDEDFETAPQAWLACQSGLFRSIFRTLAYFGEISNRVHIVVSLRDIVYSGVMKTEHASRFLDASFIKSIDWNPSTIRMFLYKKIEGIFLDYKGDDIFDDWIGMSKISNNRRVISENIDDYILRHTRMVPRDIVLMGNAISAARDKRGNIQPEVFRRVVSDIAKVLAVESMRICTIEALASSSTYIAEMLTDSDRGFKKSMYDVFSTRFEELFRKLKNEIVSKNELKQGLIYAKLALDEDYVEGSDTFYRFENVMWRRGLIAYQTKRHGQLEWVFNWNDTFNGDVIPPGAEILGFHSCLIDLYNLKISPGGPVF